MKSGEELTPETICRAKRYGCRAVGVDKVPRMIDRARERARREGVEDRVEFRVGGRRLRGAQVRHAAWLLLLFAVASLAQGFADETGRASDLQPPPDQPLVKSWGQLTWEDFQGPPPTDSDSEARLHTSLDVTSIDRILVERLADEWQASASSTSVVAYMDPSRSGVPDRMRKDKVLAHQQLHFDLTEIWARRLTREIRTLRATGTKPHLAEQELKEKVQKTFANGIAQWRAMQARYDRETNGGNKRKAQQRWQQEVAEMLRETEASSTD